VEAAQGVGRVADQDAPERRARRLVGVGGDRLGSGELLEALPRHETAHAALLADILDVAVGSSVTPAERPAPLAQELSPSELRVLRYLPTNLSRGLRSPANYPSR